MTSRPQNIRYGGKLVRLSILPQPQDLAQIRVSFKDAPQMYTSVFGSGVSEAESHESNQGALSTAQSESQ